MRRRQELPKEAFFSPEAATALFDRGDRSINSLTYRWLTGAHPDPMGTTLAVLRSYFGGGEGRSECGLFWDFASLPQKAADGRERTAEEAAMFGRGLQAMGFMYASLTRTAVLQLKDVPPCPAEYVGWVALFGVEAEADEVVVEWELQRFGEAVEVGGKGGAVHVRFATHEQAGACVRALEGDARFEIVP